MRRIWLAAMALGFVAGSVAYWLLLSSDATDRRDARRVVDSFLTSPSTANYVDISIWQRRDNNRLAHVVVDSKNEFNAVVRIRLCLVWRLIGGRPTWKHDGVIINCPDTLNYQQTERLKEKGGWYDE